MMFTSIKGGEMIATSGDAGVLLTYFSNPFMVLDD